MLLLVARPGRHGVGEAIGVQRSIDDTLVVDAELPGGIDSRKTVKRNRRARVYVDDLALTVLGALAGRVVVVEEGVEARAYRECQLRD